MARVLVAHCAFAASAKMNAGDDQATLKHLRRLRRSLRDPRGKVIARVIRNMRRLLESEAKLTAAIRAASSR
jgi:predicted protein tyrosine phosphatase